MLNNEFVHERSMALARRVIGDSKNEDEQFRIAWELALGRHPNVDELKLAKAHVSSQFGRFSGRQATARTPGSTTVKEEARLLAIASLCHVLLNSNEFLYVD